MKKLLEKALGREVSLPKKQIRTMEEFLKTYGDLKDVFIDGTECRTQRPKSSKKNHKKYSGKKKRIQGRIRSYATPRERYYLSLQQKTGEYMI